MISAELRNQGMPHEISGATLKSLLAPWEKLPSDASRTVQPIQTPMTMNAKVIGMITRHGQEATTWQGQHHAISMCLCSFNRQRPLCSH
jgi:hypothetical protein